MVECYRCADCARDQHTGQTKAEALLDLTRNSLDIALQERDSLKATEEFTWAMYRDSHRQYVELENVHEKLLKGVNSVKQMGHQGGCACLNIWTKWKDADTPPDCDCILSVLK